MTPKYLQNGLKDAKRQLQDVQKKLTENKHEKRSSKRPKKNLS